MPPRGHLFTGFEAKLAEEALIKENQEKFRRVQADRKVLDTLPTKICEMLPQIRTAVLRDTSNHSAERTRYFSVLFVVSKFLPKERYSEKIRDTVEGLIRNHLRRQDWLILKRALNSAPESLFPDVLD